MLTSAETMSLSCNIFKEPLNVPREISPFNPMSDFYRRSSRAVGQSKIEHSRVKWLNNISIKFFENKLQLVKWFMIVLRMKMHIDERQMYWKMLPPILQMKVFELSIHVSTIYDWVFSLAVHWKKRPDFQAQWDEIFIWKLK